MAPRRPKAPAGPTPVDALRHGDKRVNIPTADARDQVEHLGATAHHFGGDGSVDDSAASVDPCWESEE